MLAICDMLAIYCRTRLTPCLRKPERRTIRHQQCDTNAMTLRNKRKDDKWSATIVTHVALPRLDWLRAGTETKDTNKV